MGKRQEIVAILKKQRQHDLATAVTGEVTAAGGKAKQKAAWMKKFQDAAVKLGAHPGQIKWADATHLFFQGERPEDAAKRVYGSFKKDVIAAMLDAGKPDLATAMSKAQASSQQIVTAAPGFSRTVGAGTFDYEGEEAGVRIVSSPPRVHAHVYYPIANIGKRGKHVEVTSYQLFAPTKADQREATSAVRSALKAKKGASTQQILTAVRTAFLAAERKSINTQAKYPARFYEAARNQLGGMDPSIPSHSGAAVYSSQRGRDVGVVFDKPTITITSRNSSAVAGKGGQYHYLTVSWSQVKKVNAVAEALTKLRGLEAVQDALASVGVKYQVHQYADPMWA